MKQFPSTDSSKINKDYEILKLRKRVEEPETENQLLEKTAPSSGQTVREIPVPHGAQG
jgi:hypothetical protein